MLALLAQAIGQALHVVLAEVVVLHQHRDLGIGLGGHDVARIKLPFGLIGRLPAHGPGEGLGVAEARGAGVDEELRNLLAVEVALHRHVLRGAERSEHQQHLILLDQLARLFHRHRRVVGIVGRDEVDLAPVDAAAGVEL